MNTDKHIAAPKAQNKTTQGNALGDQTQNGKSPERA